MVPKIKKISCKIALSALACFLLLLVGIVATVTTNSKSSGSQSSSPHIERRGLVMQVIDGDTVVIDNKRVRLVGINTPELRPTPKPGAIEAKQFVEGLCLGKEVGLDVDDIRPKDKYGRTLAVVYIDVGGSWVNLNAELLRRGMAEVLYIPPSEFNPYRWLESGN
jgi:micrococcal nuclease